MKPMLSIYTDLLLLADTASTGGLQAPARGTSTHEGEPNPNVYPDCRIVCHTLYVQVVDDGVARVIVRTFQILT